MHTDTRNPDRVFMEMAVEQAKEQARRFPQKEGGDRPDPFVGCVVVTKDGKVAKGYRGEIKPNQHAEFTVMEGKMSTAVLAGATVYTTLEPCADRTPPKEDCAARLTQRKVSHVVVGCMDPDRRGQGYHKLRAANIAVSMFDDDLVAEIEELNRRFIAARQQKSKFDEKGVDPPQPILSNFPRLRQAEYSERRPGVFHEIEQIVGSTCLHGPFIQEPLIRDDGDYRPSACATRMLSKIAEEITNNEPHAFVTDIDVIPRPLIRFDVSKYSILCAEQDCKNAIRPLHAGALVVSRDRRSIFVHKRSPTVRFNKGYFHTFSGNFVARGRPQKDDTLLDTCRREVLEEIHVSINPAKGTPILICEELPPLPQYAIMVMWLGVDLPPEEHGYLRPSPEGDVHEIPFDEIRGHLLSNRWVASGMACVLAWLGLGAPGADWPFPQKAPEICKSVLSALASRLLAGPAHLP